jgi:hypothetical protein
MFKKLSDLDGIVVLAVLRKEPRREQVPPGIPEKSLNVTNGDVAIFAQFRMGSFCFVVVMFSGYIQSSGVLNLYDSPWSQRHGVNNNFFM